MVRQAQADVAVLTADSLRGRGYTHGGHLKAARYIRSRFQDAGLQPIGDTGFFQPFFVEVNLVEDEPKLSVGGILLRPGRDFLPLPGSPSDRTREAVNIVRAGTGLVIPQAGIDDFVAVRDEVKDALVVLDGRVPDSLRRDDIPAEALTEMARVQAAANLGARAVVFLTDALVYGRAREKAPVPVFHVLRDAWPVEASTAAFTVSTRHDERVPTQNVVGLIPGTAVPDSLVILMAHYDHVGALGDSVYFPGANDNASGVAMLLAFADRFSRSPSRYSVLLIAFSGEEVGLVGSRHFVAGAPVDLRRAALLLNFDMVASGEQGVMAVGGEDFPELYATLEEVNRKVGPIPLARRPNAPNSDHYFFLREGVPGLFLYTNGGTQPYHHVDDVPESLDWEDFRSVYRLSNAFIERVTAGR